MAVNNRVRHIIGQRLAPESAAYLYLTDVLTKLVEGWPMRRIDELLPWVWAQQQRGDKLAG